jgi:hypothetical protein
MATMADITVGIMADIMIIIRTIITSITDRKQGFPDRLTAETEVEAPDMHLRESGETALHHPSEDLQQAEQALTARHHRLTVLLRAIRAPQPHHRRDVLPRTIPLTERQPIRQPALIPTRTRTRITEHRNTLLRVRKAVQQQQQLTHAVAVPLTVILRRVLRHRALRQVILRLLAVAAAVAVLRHPILPHRAVAAVLRHRAVAAVPRTLLPRVAVVAVAVAVQDHQAAVVVPEVLLPEEDKLMILIPLYVRNS